MTMVRFIIHLFYFLCGSNIYINSTSGLAIVANRSAGHVSNTRGPSAHSK